MARISAELMNRLLSRTRRKSGAYKPGRGSNSCRSYGSVWTNYRETNCCYNQNQMFGTFLGYQAGGMAANLLGGLLSWGANGIASLIQNKRAQNQVTSNQQTPVAEAPVAEAPAVESPVAESPVANNNDLVDKVLKKLKKEDNKELKSALQGKLHIMRAVKKDITEEEITTRLTNYAKGWEFNQFSVKAALDQDVTFENTDCANAKNIPQLISAYEQFGKEYVEFYDKDLDNNINIYEMFYQELLEHYIIKERMDQKEAIKKATEIVERYKNEKYHINNLPKENSNDEANMFILIANKIITLEGAQGAKVDTMISPNEATAFLCTIANFDKDHGLKNKITATEYNIANLNILDGENCIVQKNMSYYFKNMFTN